MREETWVKHIRGDRFPDYCRYPSFEGSLLCSPQNIMRCFQDHKVLEGLALTVAWGRMTRSKGNIYTRSNRKIEGILSSCLRSIEKTNSAKDSWNLLVTKLGWSNVIRPGQRLIVSSKAAPRKTVAAKPSGPLKQVVYEVRPGDTLWAIGREFAVATHEIRKWNNLAENHILKPGERLTLHVSSSRG